MNIEQLETACFAYYNGLTPIMTDGEYDEAIDELRSVDPDHYFLKRVGAPVPGTKKANHILTMGSLNNVFDKDGFSKWIPEGNPLLHLSHKLDGLSIELVYQDGNFIQAITRGDGTYGEDVTLNVLKSGNIPLTIDSRIVSVRCECLIHKSDWQKHFKGEANSRNSAAGTIRRHDGTNAQYLRFYAFDEIGIDFITEGDMLEVLDRYFLVPDWIVNNVDFLDQWIDRQEDHRDDLIYEIDGVVAKLNNRIRMKEMGSKDGRPRGQIAFKFSPRSGQSVLEDVVWQVGSTGAIVPVAIVAPVGVGGTVIRRVTLCNPDEIERLDIAIGDIVEVVRAGDVIPKITKRIRKSSSNNTKDRALIIPKQCPECGSPTKRAGAHLFCTNEECTGKSLGRIMTWIRKRNILNLGIGIVEAAEIQSIADLYSPSVDEWASVQIKNGKLGLSRAKKIVEELEKSKTVSLGTFLGSIGIKGVGRSLSERLCDGLELKTLDDVFNLIPVKISSQDGFGDTRAIDFCTWLKNHREEVIQLATIMNFTKEKNMSETGSLTGKVICFTGKSPLPRKEMTAMAEEAGATVTSSITSETTTLVIADPDSISSKAKKARQNGLELISPEDFLKLVKG